MFKIPLQFRSQHLLIFVAFTLSIAFILHFSNLHENDLYLWKNLNLLFNQCFGNNSANYFFSNFAKTLESVAFFSLYLVVNITLGKIICSIYTLKNTQRDLWLLCFFNGNVLFSLFMFFFGILGLWNITSIVFFIIIIFLFFLRFKHPSRIILLHRKAYCNDLTPIERFTFCFVIIFFFITSIIGLTPQTQYDVITYHLGVPNKWVQLGGIQNLSDDLISYYPLAHSMLYAFFILFKQDEAVGLVQPFFLILCFYMLFKIRKEFFQQSKLPFEVAIFSVPIFLYNASAAGNDIIVMAFFISAFYFYMILKKEQLYLSIFISSLMIGFAISCKYSSIFFLSFWFLYIIWDTRNSLRLYKFLTITFIGICIPIFPWFIKNIIYTGNPVYPMLAEFFHSSTIEIEKIQQLSSEVRSKDGFNVLYALSLFWKDSIDPTFSNSNQYIGPIFIALFPFTLPLVLKKETQKIFLFYLLLSFAIWVTFTGVFITARYATPFLAFLLLSLSIALNNSISQFDFKIQKIIYYMYFIFITVLFSTFIKDLGSNIKFPYYHCGKMNKNEYLQSEELKILPFQDIEMFRYFNESINNKMILIVGDNKTFWLKRPHISASTFDKNILLRFVDNAQNEEEILQRFENNNIEYIGINMYEGIRLQQRNKILDMNDNESALFDKFWKKYISFVHRTKHSIIVKIEANKNGNLIPPNYIEQIIVTAKALREKDP